LRNLVLLVVTVVTVAGCSTSAGWPGSGTVWIRNDSASRVNVEVVTTSSGWFPSMQDATITVAPANGEDCNNQTAAILGSGQVTIRVSGAGVAAVQSFSFTQPQPAATTLWADVDHTLDVDAAGHAVLAHGEPPASWACANLRVQPTSLVPTP
jgi:hypothetical protein